MNTSDNNQTRRQATLGEQIADMIASQVWLKDPIRDIPTIAQIIDEEIEADKDKNEALKGDIL